MKIDADKLLRGIVMGVSGRRAAKIKAIVKILIARAEKAKLAPR